MLHYLLQAALAMSAAGTAAALLARAGSRFCRARGGYALRLAALALFLLPIGALLAPRAQAPAAPPPAPAVTAPAPSQPEDPLPIPELGEPERETRPAPSPSLRIGPEFWGLLWAGGAAVFLALFLARRGRFAWRRARLPLRDPAPVIRQALRESAERLGLAHCPEAAVCPGLGTPMLTGLWHSRVLLPEYELAEAELVPVLSHELLHYRRGDLWVKLLADLACCFHWWNPAAWLLRRDISRMGELSCDEAVAAGLGPEQKREYGRAILHVLSRAAEPDGFCAPLCGGAPFGTAKQDLKERLETIMNSRKMTKRTVALALCLGLGLTAAGALVGCGLSPEKPASPVNTEGDIVSSEIMEQTPKEEANTLASIFAANIQYDSSDGTLKFPAMRKIEGANRYLQVSGRNRMGEDDETGMSFHLFEEETANDSWREDPDHWYEAKLDPEALLSCVLYLAYTDPMTGEALAEVTVSIPREDKKQDYVFPLASEGIVVSASYGGEHRGVDYTYRDDSGKDIADGKPIFAVKAGTVDFAGWHASYGNYVDIDHGNGEMSRYAHCAELLVKEGDTVSRGQNIATVGSTGTATGPALHFELYLNGERVDPEAYLPFPGAEGPAASQPDARPAAADKGPEKGSYSMKEGGQYTFINRLFYVEPYIIGLGWTSKDTTDDFGTVGSVTLSDGTKLFLGKGLGSYAEDEAVRKAAERAVAKARLGSNYPFGVGENCYLSSVDGPYSQTPDELLNKFYDEDEVSLFSAVEQSASVSAKTGLAKRAVRDSEVAFLSILSDSLDGAEASAMAKEAAKDGKVSIFSILSDRLTAADAAAIAETACKNGEVSILSIVVDALSDAKAAELAKQAAKDGAVSVFSVLSDRLTAADALEVAKAAYEDGDISIFSIVAPRLSDQDRAELRKRAEADKRAAVLSLLSDSSNGSTAAAASAVGFRNVRLMEYDNGWPYLHDVFVNSTDKTIVKRQYYMLAYDSAGKPLKLNWNFLDSSAGATYEYLAEIEGELLPGQADDEAGGWSLYDGDKMTGWPKIGDGGPNKAAYGLYCVKQLTFADGSVWNNPKCADWLAAYKGKTIDVSTLQGYYPYMQKLL